MEYDNPQTSGRNSPHWHQHLYFYRVLEKQGNVEGNMGYLADDIRDELLRTGMPGWLPEMRVLAIELLATVKWYHEHSFDSHADMSRLYEQLSQVVRD